MAQLKDIKERINSVAKTKKMTQAMKMVAAAKFKRYSTQALNSRVFMQKVKKNIAQVMEEEKTSIDINSTKPVDSNKQLIIVIAGDRGLCGGFNSNTFKFVQSYIDKSAKQTELIIYGKKAYQFFKKKDIDIKAFYENIGDFINTQSVTKIAQELLDLYESKAYSSVVVLYNEFKSAVSTNLISKQLLPLVWDRQEERDLDSNILIEPSIEDVLEKLIFMFLTQSMFNAFLESSAAEQGARMAAMDSATDNAGDMIKELTLVYNRQRQAQITGELAEIVAGAEALSQ